MLPQQARTRDWSWESCHHIVGPCWCTPQDICFEKKAGDLVPVPKMSCHQVVNQGGLTVKKVRAWAMPSTTNFLYTWWVRISYLCSVSLSYPLSVVSYDTELAGARSKGRHTRLISFDVYWNLSFRLIRVKAAVDAIQLLSLGLIHALTLLDDVLRDECDEDDACTARLLYDLSIQGANPKAEAVAANRWNQSKFILWVFCARAPRLSRLSERSRGNRARLFIHRKEREVEFLYSITCIFSQFLSAPFSLEELSSGVYSWKGLWIGKHCILFILGICYRVFRPLSEKESTVVCL